MASSRKTATNENVSTYGNGTRGYSTLATWEAATDIDLVSATQSEVLECYDDADFDDQVVLSGATTNASYFRIVRPASGEGHDGTSNNGVFFDSTATAHLFGNNEDYSQIQDLIGSVNATGTGDLICFYCSDGFKNAIVGCIAFDSNNAGTDDRMIGFYGTPDGGVNDENYFIDCLADNITSTNGGDALGFNFKDDGDNYIYNCTVVNCGTYGFWNQISSGGASYLKNCCASGNGTTDIGDNGIAFIKTTCTAEGASPTYKNSGGNDFHLASGDTVCRGNGTDLSADGTYAFDDDIDEETRSAWDIGFDEYSAGVTGNPWYYYAQQ